MGGKKIVSPVKFARGPYPRYIERENYRPRRPPLEMIYLIFIRRLRPKMCPLLFCTEYDPYRGLNKNLLVNHIVFICARFRRWNESL